MFAPIAGIAAGLGLVENTGYAAIATGEAAAQYGSYKAMRSVAKRIRHHEKQQKQTPGEASTIRIENQSRVGKIYGCRLRLPGAEDDFNQRNLRERDIFLKGYKIDFQVFGKFVDPASQASTPNVFGYMGPCVLNWALIQFNCDRDFEEPESSVNIPGRDQEIIDEIIGEFWSSHEGSENKSRSFTGLLEVDPAPQTKWQDYWLSGSINPHNSHGFKVLAREKTYVEQIVQNGTSNPSQKTHGRICKYFKIPQHIYLHNNEENLWQFPIYMIWWISPLNPIFLANYPTSGEEEAKQFNIESRQTCYYREISK